MLLLRRLQLAAASLLDEDESYDFPYEVAGDSKVDDPETEDFMEELLRSTEEDKENRKMVVEPWKGELGDAAAVVGGESKRAEKDTAGENSFEVVVDECESVFVCVHGCVCVCLCVCEFVHGCFSVFCRSYLNKKIEPFFSIKRKIDGEEQRERVKSKIRSVQAELHELKVLISSLLHSF